MNWRTRLAKGVLGVLVITVLGGLWSAPAQAKPKAPYEWWSIAGVHLNETMKQVVNHLGPPVKKKRRCYDTCGNPRYCLSSGGWDVWYRDRLRIVYTSRSMKDYCKRGKARVDRIITGSPKDVFPGGVHIGTTRAKLRRVYRDLYCSRNECTRIECYCGMQGKYSGYQYNAVFRLDSSRRVREIELALVYGG